jgi:hypothetical protein
LVRLSHELRRNLNDGWLFNIVPGTLTIVSAFFGVDIIVALLLSQGGLGLGILNAMKPLRQIAQPTGTEPAKTEPLPKAHPPALTGQSSSHIDNSSGITP